MILTPRQEEARDVLNGPAKHILLEGGSRSGKTALTVRNVILRALKAPNSRHLITRFHFKDCKEAVGMDTLPFVMRSAFPEIPYTINKSDWFATFPNKSEIWMGGLDDKDRTEKILGKEYCVDPHSRVLCADLTWRFAKDVQVGDELIAFPENIDGHIKLMPSKVERKAVQSARRFRVVTTFGETIVSAEHSFVAEFDDRRHRNARQFSWRKAKDLRPGDVIRYACAPWEVGNSREDGWLAGVLDGEGWVNEKGRQVGVAQNPGTVLQKLRDLLTSIGVSHYEYQQEGVRCVQLKVSGMWPSMRLLGMTRPVRLMDKAKSLWSGVRAFRRSGEEYHSAKVVHIEDLGVGDVIAFGTETRTLIADGFLGHNCTIYLNEVSQISYHAVMLAVTRLAQRARYTLEGRDGELALKMYYDCNPPSKTHWVYKLFHQKLDPETKRPLESPDEYAVIGINPADNMDNLPADYLKTLAGLPARMRRRFLEGKYADVTPGQLWTEELLDTHRTHEVPDLRRIVVAVDPSGADDEDNADNDEIGIMVGGLGMDGKGYLLEDCTVKAGPKTWGSVATNAFDRHGADLIVGEKNFGGAMVGYVIDTQPKENGRRRPFKLLTASRGKAVRAEPISALHEQGKIVLVGNYPLLEAELCGMTTHGYVGDGSPNRADAFVWLFSELFPGIVREEKKKEAASDRGYYIPNVSDAWAA